MKEDAISEAVSLLLEANSAVFFTGAGVSRESGIPTFREAQTGLWSNYDPEQLATPRAFKNDPGLVWRWYDERRRKLAEVSPNPGHYAIAELEKFLPRGVVITQNVDGLHRAAGSSLLIELHGNISEFFCFQNRHPAAHIPTGLSEPPCCHCGSLIRPAVVWFHESLPEEALSRARSEILSSSVLFVVGTSSLVHPAAALPLIALQKNIPVVEINPEETPLSRNVNLTLRGSSGTILPQIIEKLKLAKSAGKATP